MYLSIHEPGHEPGIVAAELCDEHKKEIPMSSEIIVVIVIIALAVAGVVYLEIHSRGNKQSEKERNDE